MSTTISSINPNISSARTYKDLDLNFTIHPIKKDINKKIGEYAIINSVKNLVSTNFYERPFRPQIGSGVRSLLFELVDTVVATQIERAISEVLENFEPRVRVTRVVASPSPDENLYNIRMDFFIINNPNPISIDFFLERIR
jgi:phage baseplate assembly protein W